MVITVSLIYKLHINNKSCTIMNEVVSEEAEVVELKDFINQHRKSMGLSQRKLAKQAGISYSYIQLLEAGKRKDLSLTVANKLAAAFGINVDLFYSLGHTQTKRPLLSIVSELQQSIIDIENSNIPSGWMQVPVVTQSNNGDFLLSDSKDDTEDCVIISDPGNGHSYYAAKFNELPDTPGIKPGIMAIIDRDAIPNDGDLVAVHHQGKFAVRIYRYENGIKWLEPDFTDMNQVKFRGVIAEFRQPAELAKTCIRQIIIGDAGRQL